MRALRFASFALVGSVFALFTTQRADAQHTCPFGQPNLGDSVCAAGWTQTAGPVSGPGCTTCGPCYVCTRTQTGQTCVSQVQEPFCGDTDGVCDSCVLVGCQPTRISDPIGSHQGCPSPAACDGNGNCRECTFASQCGTAGACETVACVNGMCVRSPRANGSTCPGGFCYNGVCGQCAYDSQCNDNNPCTGDYCAWNASCAYYPDTGNACTLSGGQTGICRSGVCSVPECTPATASTRCNDGNPCSSDWCTADGRCEHALDDDTACTGPGGNSWWCRSGVCTEPQCTAQNLAACPNMGPCRVPMCTWNGLCDYMNLPDWSSCGGGNFCRIGCGGTAGVSSCCPAQCSTTDLAMCADNNDCTIESCEVPPGRCRSNAVPATPVPAAGAYNCRRSGFFVRDGYCNGTTGSNACVECLTSAHCGTGTNRCCNAGVCGVCDNCASVSGAGDSAMSCAAPQQGSPAESIFRVLPFGAAATVDPITADYRVRRADIYFLMDTTASMGGEIATLRAALTTGTTPQCSTPGVIGRVQCQIADAWFGIGSHDDYPIGNYGVDWMGDDVFRHQRRMTDPRATCSSGRTPLQQIFDTTGGWTLGDGNDMPESQLMALHSLATASTLNNMVVPSFRPAPTTFPCNYDNTPRCAAGEWGYACFRSNSVPIVVLLTDAPFHNGPELPNSRFPVLSNPYYYNQAIPYSGVSGAPSFATVANALTSRRMRTLVIDSSDGRSCSSDSDCSLATYSCTPRPQPGFEPLCIQGMCRGPGYDHAVALANATGSINPITGEPYVASIPCNGSGIGDAIVTQITELANNEVQDIRAEAVGDTQGFVRSIVPALPIPPSCAGITANGYSACRAGTQLSFRVNMQNVAVQPTTEPQTFSFRVRVMAGDVAIGEYPVRVVVPPSVTRYPPEATYTRIYDATMQCADDQRPDWDDMSWVADLPAGTEIELRVRTADRRASLANAEVASVLLTSTSDVDGNGQSDGQGAVDWGVLFQQLGIPYGRRIIQIDVVFRSDPTRTRAPSFQEYELKYLCVTSE